MKVGIPWYRQDHWSRWREISVDRADMPESYGEWLEKAEETIRNFTKTALEVHKVGLDIDDFIHWATNENMTVTGFTRGEFANLKLGSRR
jgi:hypothetical protein